MQELLRSLPGKTKFQNVILQLDMTKAFDRVSWEFLEPLLFRFGFERHFVTMVMNNLRGSWFSVLINGSPHGFFKSSRGIKQGDPLSPYLFILASEALSRGLNHLLDSKLIRPYRLPRGCIQISHLAFADDLTIFLQDDPHSLSNLMKFLKSFERASGQLISLDKSKFFVSSRCPTPNVRRIQVQTGYSKGSFPILYLGSHLYEGRKKINHFHHVLDAIRQRLQGWKSKMLSVGARIVLIKHVLSAMPLYTFMSQDPPKMILRKIEKILANFFWGTSEHGSNKHWSTWEKLCFPTNENGIGFRRLIDVVQAIYLKLWWKFRQGSSLWSKFMHCKYRRGLEHPVDYSKTIAVSSIWRRLHEVSANAESQIGQLIRNGNCSFFRDCWNMKEKLSNSYEWTLYPDMSFKEIHSLPSNDSLRIHILQRLSPEDLNLFSGINLDSNDSNDIFYWKRTSSGEFHLSDAWDLVRQKKPQVSSRAYIWSSRIPLKISVFMWRLLHYYLPTQDILKRQKISLASKCSFCQSEETIHHLFVSCSYATEIWKFFEHILCVFPKNRPSIHSKLKSWWDMRFSQADHEVLCLLSSLITWHIWKSRNTWIHEGNKIPPGKLCDRILISIRDISEAKPFAGISAPLIRLFRLHNKKLRPGICTLISWLPPEMNRVKLNVDGSSIGNPGPSGGGGLVRNQQGSVLFGFSSYYGSLTSLQAECRAMLEGISFCLQQGFRNVEVETDCLILQQMILGQSRMAWSLDADFRQITRLILASNFSFSHIFREANAAADLLASEATTTEQSYTFDSTCIPQSIKGTIALDAVNFPYIRHR